VALEVSSFQLHDTPSINPRVGVLTNLSSNHLDRYDSVAEYFGDKALMFKNASVASDWVTNADDADVQAMTRDVAGLHGRFSVRERSDAYFDRERGDLMVLGHPVIHRGELFRRSQRRAPWLRRHRHAADQHRTVAAARRWPRTQNVHGIDASHRDSR
jgi:UDP-N-acetylmuramoylalanine-D-glutamate ligase